MRRIKFEIGGSLPVLLVLLIGCAQHAANDARNSDVTATKGIAAERSLVIPDIGRVVIEASDHVFVCGQVVDAGTQLWSVGMTAGKAIELAGGLKGSIHDGVVRILRGTESLEFPIGSASNVPLARGDVVFVPPTGVRERRAPVSGDASRPVRNGIQRNTKPAFPKRYLR